MLDDHYAKENFTFSGLIHSFKSFGALDYFYRCFFRRLKPVGGVKVIYQHCLALREAGYRAEVIKLGGYRNIYFSYGITALELDKINRNLNGNDIVVASEFRPKNVLLFNGAKRVLFSQSLQSYSSLNTDEQKLGFREMGFDHIITCSNAVKNTLVKQDQYLSKVVTNGIDLDVFYPIECARVPKRILALKRKNHQIAKEIHKRLEKTRSDFEFVIVDNLTENELAKEFQKADVFLSLGYPEGFGLPSLEAMACGCVVVGFSGGGGLEYMKNNYNSLVAPDGDIEQLSIDLFSILDNEKLRDRLRKRGIETSKNFSLKKTKKNVVNVYESILSQTNDNERLFGVES